MTHLQNQDGGSVHLLLEFDALGSEDQGDLRLGATSCHVEPLEGGSFDAAFLGRLTPEVIDDLLVVAVMAYGLIPNKRDRPDHNDRSGRGVWVTEREARQYLDPELTEDPESRQTLQLRAARAWWEAKLRGDDVALSVASARGEGSPKTEAAQNRANVYVAGLRKSGLLGSVGAERGFDIDEWYGRGKPTKEVRQRARERGA